MPISRDTVVLIVLAAAVLAVEMTVLTVAFVRWDPAPSAATATP